LTRGISKDIFFIDNLLTNQEKIPLDGQSSGRVIFNGPSLMSNFTVTRQQTLFWPPVSLKRAQWKGMSENVVYIHPLSSFYASIKGSDLHHYLFQWAFIIGNYQYFPFYIAVGQHNASFGFYYTRGIEKPLTTQLGYMPDKANASIGWKVDWNQVCDFKVLSSFFQDEVSVGIQYHFHQVKWFMKMGLSYATDIVNGSWEREYAKKAHFIDAYFMFNRSPLQFVLEGITTLRSCQQHKMTQLSGMRRPLALHSELSYRRRICHQPITFAITLGYGAGYMHGTRFEGMNLQTHPLTQFCGAIKMPIKTPYIQLSMGFKQNRSINKIRNSVSVQIEAVSC
jgi:hypothetical protein